MNWQIEGWTDRQTSSSLYISYKVGEGVYTEGIDMIEVHIDVC